LLLLFGVVKKNAILQIDIRTVCEAHGCHRSGSRQLIRATAIARYPETTIALVAGMMRGFSICRIAFFFTTPNNSSKPRPEKMFNVWPGPSNDKIPNGIASGNVSKSSPDG